MADKGQKEEFHRHSGWWFPAAFLLAVLTLSGLLLGWYLRPLYDALTERLGTKRLKQMLADGIIEIAPVAYMRGRTLSECFVVIDEAQNCTYTQIKMLLTRLGWRSTMVLTGDPDQTDLLPGISGLADIASRLERVPDIPVVRLAEGDIVRHPLVASMLTVL